MLEPFKVKLHRVLDELHDLVAGFRGGYAVREIGYVRAEAFRSLFNHYCVSHVGSTALGLGARLERDWSLFELRLQAIKARLHSLA